MLTETHPPSKYAKNPVKAKINLQDKRISICDHRSEVGDDVTLYYPQFHEFVKECNNQESITKRDIESARRMCEAMSPHLTKEKERRDTFVQLMKKEYGIEMEKEHHFQYKLIKENSCPCDAAVKPNSCVILECKNESGKGGESDSHSQVIAYYIASLEEKSVDQCPAPAYLIELVGTQLTISGAVYGRDVFVDKLKVVSLEPQCNEEEMIKIVRILKALKHAIEKIKAYYRNVIQNTNNSRYPTFQSFNKDNIEYTIEYTETIKPHMFKGIITNDENKEVIIKFVKQYSSEAHQFMHDKEYAPELIFHAEKIEGTCTQYTAIVMEYIPDARSLDELLLEEDEQYRISTCCIEALKVMHEDGYCHGKISSKSIFGKFQDGRIKILIVNYEWAGRQGEARYPLSADIPEGVQPGDLITQEHNEKQLDELLPYGLDRLFQ